MEIHVATSAFELTQVISKYTFEDSGCDWVVVGDCIYIRDSSRKPIAQIRRKQNAQHDRLQQIS